MTEESSTTSHLPVAMTTNGVDDTQTTIGDTMTSSSSSEHHFYFRCALVVIGVVGTAGNALVLYALVVSKQHKKHPMIVNQNALDFFCSFFLVVSSAVKLCNICLTGTLGFWLCATIDCETFVSYGMYGSRISIAAITVERYLKVVHPVWSRKNIRSWTIHSTMAFCWLFGIVSVAFKFKVCRIKNGVCSYVMSKEMIGFGIWYILSFYVIIFAIFIFCYGRILVAIRRQARVMAAHSAAGDSSTAQTLQSGQIQTNVIKTMILVSALYVICHLLQAVLTIDRFVDGYGTITYSYVDDVSRFIQFLYITANPFIYATKFDPVKKVLKDMIPKCTGMPHNLVV